MRLNEFGDPFNPVHGSWYLLLFVLAGLVGGYVVAQAVRRARYQRFANTEILDKVAPKRPRLARHVPTAVFIVGLLFLIIALSGPTAMSRVAKNRSTLILLMDISKSMAADDVKPTRIDAARLAAVKFVDGVAPTIQLGLVTFAGVAEPLVRPSTEHEMTRKIIDQVVRPDKLAPRTATGEGIYAALQQIETLSAVFGGNHAPPARIVLVSDGKETVPDDPNSPRGEFSAARAAKEKKIPISAISFGTDHGTIDIDGRTMKVPVEVDTLKKIADLSGGHQYSADSQDQLTDVYKTLNDDIGYDTVKTESGRMWALSGTLLVVIAAGTSFVFNRALP